MPILRTFQLFPLPIMVQKLPFRTKYKSVMIISVYGTLFVTKNVTPILAFSLDCSENLLISRIFNYLVSVISQKAVTKPVIVNVRSACYDYFDVSPQRKIFSKETISQKMRDPFRSYSRKHAQYLIVLSDFRTFPFLCSFFSSQILTC